MSTDRELLELAAKAAGVHLAWNGDFPHQVIERWSGNPEEMPDYDHEPWNPLTDDGDALRLAMRLRVSIDHNHPADQSPWVSATADGGRAEKVEEFEDERDRCAATRMAIVRAAAEIGRRMP